MCLLDWKSATNIKPINLPFCLYNSAHRSAKSITYRSSALVKTKKFKTKIICLATKNVLSKIFLLICNENHHEFIAIDLHV